ncbi:CHAD domain-containing protein [Fusibacter bizertensis]|uniref:CHAD domain-containing protein n=1 Tax=Fusibacter bizertensis TaxID=1488331 RepID=A0ABT6NDN5_9FIRM|nr:CHAD domain-containing protein [Fusibacter bizertensis]MDH8678501.1 CHAD domain-containing protein [Fusibacter bizertensis]
MVEDRKVTMIMEKHLEAIDLALNSMVSAQYDHESIHMFRESIRQFRALMYFFMPNIRPSDYRKIEQISKKYFMMTSLIREIDVFEIGYKENMNEAALEKLKEIKEPLMINLINDLNETNAFKFQQLKIVIKPFQESEKKGNCLMKRQCDLLRVFINREEEQFGEEKYIHAKRMLAKKLIYIHNILLPNDPKLEMINKELDLFQIMAKQVHDACVNLRFIGHYQFDDQELVTKIVHDHALFTAQAADQYNTTCNVIEQFLEK